MDNYTVLEWLYKQLKKKRIALGNAERKPNVNSGEIEDIKRAIDTIEWIIAVVLEKGGKIPSDVVEVVRCKDCKHCKKHTTSDKVKMCTNSNWSDEFYPLVKDNEYCSCGERKEK